MSSIYQRGKIYWYKHRVDGKPCYQSLKTKSQRVAITLQKKLDKKYSNPTYKPDHDNNLEYWIDRYLVWLKQSVSNQHLDHCKSRLYKFANFCGDIQPETITVEIVQGYLDQLPHGPKTINYYKYAISKYLKFCRNKGLAVDIMAATAAMTPVSKRRLPRFLSTDQECEVLRLAYRYDKNLYLRIIVAIRTGMRMSEIIRMRWEYVDFDRNTILVPKSKNGRPRAIPLHKTLRKRLYRIRKKTGPVFSGAGRTWSKELAKIKTPFFTEGKKCKKMIEVLCNWKKKNCTEFAPHWWVGRRLKWSEKDIEMVRNTLVARLEIDCEMSSFARGGRTAYKYKLKR